MRDELRIEVRKLNATARLPERTYDTDTGYDIRACLWQGWRGITLLPGDHHRIHTGIAIAVPPTHFLRLTARSSTQHYVLEGVIDSDYRGEIIVGVLNPTREAITIRDGDRIAQFVIHERISADWVEVRNLPDTPRGSGGFGSTGKA